ncbi:hypothetical protein DM02DRAFT_649369 [Periconia macrospinosa]|uniref:MARVEL domain-containing protein n=1 Tax=Periconia macrospinosa TaxID=97972 RepID=A0A2V1E8W5_9PLEO|nr:hypothetical protein DM02DRAFT_649369 [Periconia macrospinosa]
MVNSYQYQPPGKTDFADFEGMDNVYQEDAQLKARIRRLRLISRVASTVISIAVLVPITITLHKFLTTKNVFRDVRRDDGTVVNRNPWFKDTKEWPTYMYFAVAAISTTLNFCVLVSYLRGGVESANKSAYVSSFFSWAIMLGNLIVWCVAAALYRTEKATDDIWGWACSPLARKIQKEFADQIDFQQSCTVQSTSWYIGLAQVGAAALTVFTYILVIRRKKTKSKINRRMSQMPGQYPTNY